MAPRQELLLAASFESSGVYTLFGVLVRGCLYIAKRAIETPGSKARVSHAQHKQAGCCITLGAEAALVQRNAMWVFLGFSCP